MSVKKSVGLCLIRYRPEQTRLVPEVLLVCKRYTYAYFDFIYGKCKNSRATLDKMTADEKFDILSGDFERMWYRIWFNHPKPPTYMMLKNRFEAKYMLDGGKRLRAEIEQSVNSPRLWDIPKGRKQPRESDVVCAVRELYEETGVSRRLYNIVPGITRSTSHTDAAITYNSLYYVGVCNTIFPVKLSFSNREQTAEISEVSWVPVAAIPHLDITGRIVPVVQRALCMLKERRKNAVRGK